MLLAADLHLHSRYSKGVSPAMTLENIAEWSLRKGMDIVGTGDCLQPAWLAELSAHLRAAEPGMFTLRAEAEARVFARLPEALRRPLRFVLSTEVNCQPPGKGEFQGLHFLLYVSSFAQVSALQRTLAPHGDLSEGRPTLHLTPLQLLEIVLTQGDDLHVAPAHILNPWFSALGTIGGESSLAELFPDHTGHLLAVETGLTSTPPMCRRLSSLDDHALFACSDAHSLDNLGREYTLVEIEPSYEALFSALRAGRPPEVAQLIKFPLYRTRYFLKWCSRCQLTADTAPCPKCNGPMVEGSRDRLERIADRPLPGQPADGAFQELLPLAYVVGAQTGRKPDHERVKADCRRFIDSVGSERFILTQATESALLTEIPLPIVRAILRQRSAETDFFRPTPPPPAARPAQQGLLNLGH